MALIRPRQGQDMCGVLGDPHEVRAAMCMRRVVFSRCVFRWCTCFACGDAQETEHGSSLAGLGPLIMKAARDYDLPPFAVD